MASGCLSEQVNELTRMIVVGPMDTVGYFDEGQFGEIFVQSKLAQCDTDCYQHIFDGNNKAHKTSVGYIDAEIAIGL
ncbi:MAG: hypothetical protein CMP98_04650 [Gammaproteobacteria bacterium]|nr:hypothetical protein [Gammaproteobacteria bacterium]